MPVRILTSIQKDIIASHYKHKVMTQKELAQQFQVSERTINRILVEHGLATPVARIKGDAYQVMQLLKQYDLDKDSLQRLLEKSFVQAA